MTEFSKKKKKKQDSIYILFYYITVWAVVQKVTNTNDKY